MRLHRNNRANFGICGHGLHGRWPSAEPSLPGGSVRNESEKELSGTVTSVEFTNLDGSLALAARNQDGSSTEWVMTLGSRKRSSATALALRGIGKTGASALHTGTRSNRDQIKVRFLPARDGSPLGLLRTVIMPDGRVIQISAGNPND